MRMVFPHTVSGRFMDELASDMSSLVETFLGEAKQSAAARTSNADGDQSAPRWAIPMDITETENEFRIDADLPGVPADAIDLEVAEEQVTVVAHRAVAEPAEDESPLRQERRFGESRRVVQLPKPIDTEAVTATYVDGVLKITLPKLVEKSTSRRV